MDADLSLKSRIGRVLLAEHGSITLLLGVLALLLSAGFFISSTNNSNYTLLEALASFKVWASVFAIYGITKLWGCLYRIDYVIKVTTSIAGLWLWNYLILSFIVFDTTKLAPTEMMLIIVLICEVWDLTTNMFNKNICWNRRSSDARNKCKLCSPDSWCFCDSLDSNIGRLTINTKELES